MFTHCDSLTSLDVSSFDTSNVLDMERMFDHCAKLQKLDLTAFDTSRVTDMYRMFADCPNLRYLDLSSFDASKVTDADKMFEGTSLLVLKTPKNLTIDVPLGKTMYDASGKAYTKLPKSSKSIRLATTKKKAFEFRDVRNMSLWYYDAVYWAYENDITSGMGEGTFQPMADLTRAQAVTFLYKMAGEPNVDGYPDPGFKDVKKSDWFYNAVKWAVAKKITSGYGQGTFSPNAKCTRAMIVTFLSNYARAAGIYEEPTKSSGFKDVSSNAWYKKAVDWAVENGITSGYGAGTFRPDVICNRAMMVTFLMKVDALKAS
jgi:surface protein